MGVTECAAAVADGVGSRGAGRSQSNGAVFPNAVRPLTVALMNEIRLAVGESAANRSACHGCPEGFGVRRPGGVASVG
ncbi:hypothetical protein P3T35_007280 [Kitasatospora sp. GP30]|nr:hypothetical protein [Kitasatospora sp. GP30]